jgi:hypothetical protein
MSDRNGRETRMLASRIAGESASSGTWPGSRSNRVARDTTDTVSCSRSRCWYRLRADSPAKIKGTNANSRRLHGGQRMQ